jgi:hypothetical protein
MALAVASAASADDNICKKKGLTKGSGTSSDACKFSTEILKAKYTGKIVDFPDGGGAVFSVTNPWPEDLSWAKLAVYYYDAKGKQLTATINGDVKKSSFCMGPCFLNKVLGKKTSEVVLGFRKDQIPAGATKIEVDVLGFGFEQSGQQVYFTSVKDYVEDRPLKR